MAKGHGKLTVGDLCGKRPAVSAASSTWWRQSGKKDASAAPEMKGFCCGSGCAGCPYMAHGAGVARA